MASVITVAIGDGDGDEPGDGDRRSAVVVDVVNGGGWGRRPISLDCWLGAAGNLRFDLLARRCRMNVSRVSWTPCDWTNGRFSCLPKY